jgi:hypothetical protein
MDVQAPQWVARRVGSAVAVAVFALACPEALRAQDGPPTASALPQWEWRIDGTAAAANAVHSGLGLNIRSGWYLRSGIALGTGVFEDPAGNWRSSHRLDLTARFLVDPFAERRRAVYAGGGVTVRSDAGGDPQARVLVLIGIEGDPERRRIPAIELGLGGGVRLGLVLRTRRGAAR